MKTQAEDAVAAFARLRDIVARLRGPGGCPWDQEQTPGTLRGSLIEETYECVEAIDEGDPLHTREELGDLFFVALMIAYMHEEAGAFTVAQTLEDAADKLTRRHPHVFGEVRVQDSDEALANWARIKVEQEGRRPKDALLDEVRRGLPPLDRAFKLQKKAAKAGFDWPDADGPAGKVREELAELEEARRSPEGPGAAVRVEEEAGDLLFAAVNLCRHCHVEPSVALQRANAKFTRRFGLVEKRMKEAGLPLTPGPETLARMDAFWNEVKDEERSREPAAAARPS